MKTITFKGFRCLLQFSIYPMGNRISLVLTNADIIRDEDENTWGPGTKTLFKATANPEKDIYVPENHIVVDESQVNAGIYETLLKEGIISTYNYQVQLGYNHWGFVCNLKVKPTFLNTNNL